MITSGGVCELLIHETPSHAKMDWIPEQLPHCQVATVHGMRAKFRGPHRSTTSSCSNHGFSKLEMCFEDADGSIRIVQLPDSDSDSDASKVVNHHHHEWRNPVFDNGGDGEEIWVVLSAR